MRIYLEVGAKKTFASAVDWPGWARGRLDEHGALATLLAYGPRYASSMGSAATDFHTPESVDAFEIVERLVGNSTTDFGAPGVVPSFDNEAITDEHLERDLGLLAATWTAFERAADSAEGEELGPAGPRGGGRLLHKIRAHVIDAQAAYISALGGGFHPTHPWPKVQADFVDFVHRRARGEVPDQGPRGGKRWPARYAIRRSAWHVLDHAWEIEDRVIR